MPTYEYKCEACEHTFERFQSMTAPPTKKCPECGKNKVRRLLGTGAGLIFKGSGFYITDYRDSSYKESARKDSGGAASSGGDSKSSSGAKSGGGSKSSSTGASTSTAPAAAKPSAGGDSGSGKGSGKS